MCVMTVNLTKLLDAHNRLKSRLSPEEYEEHLRELEAKGKESMEKFRKLCDEQLKANAHNIKAEKVLLEELRSAASHPDMTPDVRDLVDTFIHLIRYKVPLFQYDYSSYFEPVIEHERKAGISEHKREIAEHSRKPEGRERAKQLWDKWALNPAMFKNQTKFCAQLVNECFCDSQNTALRWCKEFREEEPNTALEKILPQKK